MRNKKIDIKFHSFSDIIINTRQTSFNNEIYTQNLLEKENNLNVLEIFKSFYTIKEKVTGETLKEILENSSNEKKEKHFFETQIWIESFELQKPTDSYKSYTLLISYFTRIIKIVREQILSNAAKNSKKKNIVKTIFDYSDIIAPLPEIHFCLMNTSYFLNLESTFQIENSTKIKPTQIYKKKPLFLLKKVKIQQIKTKFERKRNDYLKLLKRNPLLLNSRQSDKQVFAESSDKQLVAEFEDLLTETVGNPEEIKKLKANKKLLIQKTNQMFEEATISWHSFLKKRQKFEDQENSNLAAKLLETLLRDFKNSDNFEVNASTTLTVVKVWERCYTVITNAWFSNVEKEYFQRDKVTNKELSFSIYKKTKSVSLDYKDLTNQIRDQVIYMSSVNSTKNKLQTNNLTEKDSQTIKKEVSSQVSKPLVEALFASGILKLESVKERKERSLQEGEFLSAEDLKESNYNVVTLNLNEAELSRGVNSYENNFYKI